MVRGAVGLYRQAHVGEGEVRVVSLDAVLGDGVEAVLAHRLVEPVLDRGHPDGAARGLHEHGARVVGTLGLEAVVSGFLTTPKFMNRPLA